MTSGSSARRIGAHAGTPGGPLVLVVAAIHGNEPAGVAAAEAVLAGLAARRPPFRGRLEAVRGNVKALGAGVRFHDVDLNRAFGPARVEAVRRGELHDAEAAEQRELLDVIDALAAESFETRVVLDLHTSSSDGAPFATLGDTLRNRAFQERFPVPKVLGLEEQIDGSLLEHLSGRGYVTMGFEGGQHADPGAVARHEALIWLALRAAGCLDEAAVPDLASCDARLRAGAPGVPEYVEVRHRHAIRPGDDYRMAPGYRHFQRVKKGELLGRDAHGDVRAPEDGLVLLPLYQGRGDDGFFLGRELRPFWLRLSALLRNLGLPALAPLLPGVHRDQGCPTRLVVDRRVARIWALQIFHLLGYRKLRERDRTLVIERRRE